MIKAATTTLLGLTLLAFAVQPAGAKDAAVQYVPTALSDTVTMLKGQGGNIAVSSGQDGVFIIDDQYSHLADQLMAAIGKVSDEPIRFVINTHYHHDHVGGNEAVGDAGAVIIAHDNIRERMSTEQFSNFFDAATPPWPSDALPVVTFNDRMTLHYNGEPVTAYHVPHGHTDGDSIIHFPSSNVLHMGDIFFNGLYPYIDLDGGGSIDGMIAGVEKGLSLCDGNTQVIPGHGPLANRAGLAEYRDLLVTIRDRVQTLVNEGKTLQEATEANPTADWDEELGGVFIKPDQLVIFVYNSLTGVERYTPLDRETTE
ncbi:MAG: MBL fold metallo-hydrolase [Xanthomonadales bacterium]|nr:MBL fold metallo-hydrolase [Gammaproteobacteria bacterium]MBT8051423.1 MBL fold metallo-hydrolase [Gammaproteobacteria bacterium]NNJ78555.1 MBL fold metallo-hydrolase [Xanthomonadales bacterium]NNL04737.1 MBL fold metallo-hydrolase [Xanthomonadales bacterium]